MKLVTKNIQPHSIPVDEQTEIEITVSFDKDLQVGENFSFALPVAWYCQRYCITFTKEPQFTDSNAENLITVGTRNAEFSLTLDNIPLPSGKPKGHVRKIVAKITEGKISAGEKISIGIKNFRAPWLADRGKVRFWLNEEEIEDTLYIDTIAATAERLRVIVPSSVKPNEEFEVKIISLDPFWNCSSSVFRQGVLRIFGSEIVEENISFTGLYTTVVKLSNPGIHRFQFNAYPLKDTLIEDEALSNPVMVTENPSGPFWGDTHGHNTLHNCGAGEHALDYARDVSCLDFVALTPDYRALSKEVWEKHKKELNEKNEDSVFITIPSYEVGFLDGHHNVYFRDDTSQMWDTSDSKNQEIDALIPKLDPEKSLLIPHHVGVHWRPQSGYYAGRDTLIPLIEIYSQHGLAERYASEHILAFEFNRTRGKEQKYASSVNRAVYVRDALAQGRKYGLVASSDDHMGQPGKPIKGCTAVFSEGKNRETIFDNLKLRHTYASTGERILIKFSINEKSMGEELTVSKNEDVDIHFEVYGTDKIAFVEIVKLTFENCDWETVFYERIEEKNLFQEGQITKILDYKNKFTDTICNTSVYYLRMSQQKTIADYPVFAWTSPIWVSVAAEN
jgi:hypothetical protein